MPGPIRAATAPGVALENPAGIIGARPVAVARVYDIPTTPAGDARGVREALTAVLDAGALLESTIGTGEEEIGGIFAG